MPSRNNQCFPQRSPYGTMALMDTEHIDIVKPEHIIQPIWKDVTGRKGVRHLVKKRFRKYHRRIKLAEQKGRPLTTAFMLRHTSSDYIGLMIAYDEVDKVVKLFDMVRESAQKFELADPDFLDHLAVAIKDWLKSTTDNMLTKAAKQWPECKAPIKWEGATFYIDS